MNKIRELEVEEIYSLMHEHAQDGVDSTLSPRDANHLLDYIDELEYQYVYTDQILEVLRKMAGQQAKLLLELQETIFRIAQEKAVD